MQRPEALLNCNCNANMKALGAVMVKRKVIWDAANAIPGKIRVAILVSSNEMIILNIFYPRSFLNKGVERVPNHHLYHRPIGKKAQDDHSDNNYQPHPVFPTTGTFSRSLIFYFGIRSCQCFSFNGHQTSPKDTL